MDEFSNFHNFKTSMSQTTSEDTGHRYKKILLHISFQPIEVAKGPLGSLKGNQVSNRSLVPTLSHAAVPVQMENWNCANIKKNYIWDIAHSKKPDLPAPHRAHCTNIRFVNISSGENILIGLYSCSDQMHIGFVSFNPVPP